MHSRCKLFLVAWHKIDNQSFCSNKFLLILLIKGKFYGFQDDYGSPLVQNNELVGIFNDNYQGELLTFTSIPKFYKWIAESIKRNSVGDEADGIVDNDEVIDGSIGNEAEEEEANDNGQEEGDKSDSGNEE